MSELPRRRRALTHVGGAITTQGDSEDARRLAHALAVPPSPEVGEDSARAHVHGFHSYPARMHPESAARFVEAFSPVQGSVLDPFCGSGTVLVEAMLQGRAAVGVDLNPLAVRLARCKTRPRSPEELSGLILHAQSCAAHAEERRRTRAGATRRYSNEDVRLFEPHVLLELDSLRAGVEKIDNPTARLDLSLVLSSILVKLSRQAGDTSTIVAPRRLAPGFPSRLFVKKTEELTQRLQEFTSQLPTPPPSVSVTEEDATELRSLPARAFTTVITSPPYAATYDYLAHHALRLRWLGLDAARLQRSEMGARANYRHLSPQQARTHWAGELARFLRAAHRVLLPGAPLVMMLADSAVGEVALRADAIVAETAPGCGFFPSACASQVRPHFHGPTQKAFRRAPRAEHAICLRRER